MKIKRLTQDSWRPIHNGTVLIHRAFMETEIRAPFRMFWAKMEAGTEMEIDKGHPKTELFVIIRGMSKLIIGKEKYEVKEGDTVYVPPHAVHWFKNDSKEDLHFIVVKYLETEENAEVTA